MVGHHDRQGLNTSPPAVVEFVASLARAGRRLRQDDLKSTGGDGLFYCFAAQLSLDADAAAAVSIAGAAAFSVAAPARMAAEPVRHIGIYVQPYYEAAREPGGTPRVAVGRTLTTCSARTSGRISSRRAT